jgi:hypothetical protein
LRLLGGWFQRLLKKAPLGSAALQRRVQIIHFLSSRGGFSRRGVCCSDFFRKLFNRRHYYFISAT